MEDQVRVFKEEPLLRGSFLTIYYVKIYKKTSGEKYEYLFVKTWRN